jgi:uncharacterized membrane protein required for colicin V production
VTLLDLAVLGLLLLGALLGYCIGLLRPGLAWLGVAPGLLVATRIMPWVLSETAAAADRWHPLAYPLGVTAGVLVAGALAGHLAGYLIGRLLHLALPDRLRTADRVAGCIVGAAVVGTVIWLLVPMAATTPGWFAEQSEGSFFVRVSLEHLPAPPEALDRVVAWVRLNAE